MNTHTTILVGLTALILTSLCTQAAVLADFNFENHTSGAALGGPVGTARSSSSGLGDAFDFNNNTTTSNYSVSVLTENGPGDLNAVGANVRSDTVANQSFSEGLTGNFLEIAPHRLTNTNSGDKNPSIYGGDYLSFTVQANAGYSLNLNSFSYDKGVADGADPGSTVSFQTQAWYSLDGGTSWTKIQEDQNFSHSPGGNISSSSSFTNLSDVTELQNVVGSITIALSLGDNSGRNPYLTGSAHPAAYYLDNIQLAGDLTAIPEPGTFALLAGTLGLAFSVARRRR